MSISYNLTGAERKALVQAISDILGKPAVYQGAPTFAYATGFYIVDKNGTLTYPESSDLEGARQLVAQLRGRGCLLTTPNPALVCAILTSSVAGGTIR